MVSHAKECIFARLWAFSSVGLVRRLADDRAKLTGSFFSYIVSGAFSSVGLERRLDRAEVTGSNPVMPTYFLHFCGYMDDFEVIITGLYVLNKEDHLF